MIHFAGLKAVGESVEKPIEYYDTNVGGAFNKLDKLITDFDFIDLAEAIKQVEWSKVKRVDV